MPKLIYYVKLLPREGKIALAMLDAVVDNAQNSEPSSFIRHIIGHKASMKFMKTKSQVAQVIITPRTSIATCK